MRHSGVNSDQAKQGRWLRFSVGFSAFLLCLGINHYLPGLTQTDQRSGQVLGCDGTPLGNYADFTVGLYHPDPTTPAAIQELVSLPVTAANQGISPNLENKNPFFLQQETQGRFNFLLNQQQVQDDSSYILIVNPPENSNFGQRRIKVRFHRGENNQVLLNAIALDGLPIDFRRGQSQISNNLPKLGSVTVLSFNIGICDQEALRITKSSDRASASPGEVAVYRLQIKNLATGDLEDIEITDSLPKGVQVKKDSIQAQLNGEDISLNSTLNQQTLTLRLNQIFPKNAIMNIAYAAEFIPDALRGNGENTARVMGKDRRNGLAVKDGPAVHEMRVRGGLLSDAGTILGRVFVDENLDGEQQKGEPGVPNAIIVLDNGIQMTTDAEGLFSITNVLPGQRTGVLDLTSLPEYILAPNENFIERNSQSRLVNLPPGGTVRMNFAVIPITNKEEK